MARREAFDFRNSPQLRPFVLHHIRPTGRKIGDGSYGTVEELDMGGLICAGKKLHDILVESGNMYDGRDSILRRFVEECSLLSGLRHPNVVQFLGICFLEMPGLPVLVMEFLPHCLDSLLDPGEGAERVEIPLGVKYDILSDTAQGLVHLHTQTPPIIHRDLTAKNILLTSAMMGKVADLGVARLLNLQPGRLAVTMTKAPGTLAYMPPEVLEENPEYNASIDMFSFGHLILYTIVQDFPYPTAPTRPDPHNPGMVIGLTEVQRRSRQMQELSRMLGGEGHPLVQLVARCLHNDPRQRPSARQVLTQLQEMRAQIVDGYGNMSKLELVQALRRREVGEREAALQAQVTQLQGQLQALEVASQAEIQQVQHRLQAREVELEASRAQTQQVQAQLRTSQTEIQQYRSRLEISQAETLAQTSRVEQVQAESRRFQTRLEQVQGQLRAKEAEVQRCQSRTQHVEAQWRADTQKAERDLRTKDQELKSKDQENQELRAQLRRGNAEATGLMAATRQPAQARQPPRSFKWRQGKNLLFGTSEAHAVVLNGKVYVGGGYASRDGEYTIQVYTPEAGGWSRLPKSPVKWFALAVLNHQLVLVGGWDGWRYHARVLVWDSTSQRWTTPYPNFPTARNSPAAVGYQQYLVIAGGSNESPVTSVDILDSTTKRWSTAAPLPIGCAGLTAAVVGDILYLLGGNDGPLSPNKHMFSVSLPALVTHATSTPRAPPPTWQVTEAKFTHSTAVSLYSSLLAVGGKDASNRYSSNIQLYSPQTRQWKKIGDVPAGVSQCACNVLSSGDLIMIGGLERGGQSEKLHVASVN